jgi:hypothetical protein
MSSGAELIVLPVAFAVGRGLDGAATALGSAADAYAARQQRRRQARARLDRARTEYEALCERVAAERDRHGPMITPPPPPPPVADGVEGADAAITAIGQLAAAVEERLRVELSSARTTAVLAGLAADLADLRQATSAAAPRGHAAERHEELTETVRRVFERLDLDVSPTSWEEISGRARAVLIARPESVRMLLDDLRYSVQRANDAVTARRRELADLHQRLDRFEGDAIEAARRRLYAAADDPEPDWPALTDAVNAAIDQVAVEARDTHVAQALAQALEEVGCEVEEGFGTLLVSGGIAHLRPAGLGEFAVRVRRPPGQADGTLRFNMVTASDQELGADTEQAWCSTLDELLPILTALGVTAHVRGRSEIGEIGAQRVNPARFPFDRVVEHQRAGELTAEQTEGVDQAEAARQAAARRRRDDRGRPGERRARPE